MDLIGLLILLIIAAVAGAIGQSIAGYSLGGCIVSAVVGFIGALLGGWMANAFGLPEWFVVRVGGYSFPVIWSIIGATAFALAVGLISRGRGRYV